VLYLRADQDEDHPSGTSQSRVEHAPKGINKKKTIKNKTNSLKLYINSIIANSGLLNKHPLLIIFSHVCGTRIGDLWEF